MGEVLPRAGEEDAESSVVEGDFRASPPTKPPSLLLVRRRLASSPSLTDNRDGDNPISLLAVRLLPLPPLLDDGITFDRRGDDDGPSPSSFRSASDVPLSVEASNPSNSRSRVCRRIDAAMTDGEE